MFRLENSGGVAAAELNWRSCMMLVALIVLYGFHLVSFTIFDGFTTLSSDAFGYVLLAKKWSPWFAPSLAETLTWPAQTYPPAMAWLLSISGASESTWFAHLLVSFLQLLAMLLTGWLAIRELGAVRGMLVVSVLGLMPGIVYSTLGILSENLYFALTMAALLLGNRVAANPEYSARWFLALGFLLTLGILTRTIGIALIGAFLAVSVFDRRLAPRTRLGFLLTATASLVLWQLWNVFDTQSAATRYVTFLSPMIDTISGDFFAALGLLSATVKTNTMAMITGWDQYLTLGQPPRVLRYFSEVLLGACVLVTLVRLLWLKLDALYIVFSALVLMFWPYPEEMFRFIHPIVMLLLLQPFFVLWGREVSKNQVVPDFAVYTMIALVAAVLLAGHYRLIQWKNIAQQDYPWIVHAREYYRLPNRDLAMQQALIFQDVMKLMESTSEIVPEGSVVASDQHAAYTLLADRQAVNLSSIVPLPQQLCNFEVGGVTHVFLSALTNSYNPLGVGLYEHYKDLTAQTWSINDVTGKVGAYVLLLDADKVRSELSESEFECREFRDRP